jgi:translation initiation factor 1
VETIQLVLEMKGRRGKAVTILKGFTRDLYYLEALAKKLKESCGTGGTLKNSAIEIQGDLRDRICEILLKEGFQVKG